MMKRFPTAINPAYGVALMLLAALLVSALSARAQTSIFADPTARQAGDVLTSAPCDHLFKSQLSGSEGAGWMKGQTETQRDVLTKHLVDSGALRISDLLLRQGKRSSGRAEPSAPAMPQKMTSRASQPLPLFTSTNAFDD